MTKSKWNSKEGAPLSGPWGVLDLQLLTGTWPGAVFWCVGKPTCWAVARTARGGPGRSQRGLKGLDTKRIDTIDELAQQKARPRTRVRALPAYGSARVHSWAPLEPPNSGGSSRWKEREVGNPGRAPWSRTPACGVVQLRRDGRGANDKRQSSSTSTEDDGGPPSARCAPRPSSRTP